MLYVESVMDLRPWVTGRETTRLTKEPRKSLRSTEKVIARIRNIQTLCTFTFI